MLSFVLLVRGLRVVQRKILHSGNEVLVDGKNIPQQAKKEQEENDK
jgi:hypothetical protein